MRKISTSYEDISNIKIDGFRWPIKKIANFEVEVRQSAIKTNPDVDERVYISGKTFMIDLIGYAHFHFLYDKLAQYEFVKHYVPDLKLYIMTNKKDKETYKNLLFDLREFYGVLDTYILDLAEHKTYIFKENYLIWPTHNEILRLSFPEVFFEPWSYKDDFKFYITKIRELFLKRFDKVIQDIDPSRKIFISRFKQHEKNGRGTYPIKAGARYISREDELRLEQFFADLGYTIDFAENYRLADQVALYSVASHIASLKSSSFVNMIFCNEQTHLISINLDDMYQVWYDWIAKMTGLQYREFPDLGQMSHSIDYETYDMTSFSIDQIIEALSSNKDYL